MKLRINKTKYPKQGEYLNQPLIRKTVSLLSLVSGLLLLIISGGCSTEEKSESAPGREEKTGEEKTREEIVGILNVFFTAAAFEDTEKISSLVTGPMAEQPLKPVNEAWVVIKLDLATVEGIDWDQIESEEFKTIRNIHYEGERFWLELNREDHTITILYRHAYAGPETMHSLSYRYIAENAKLWARYNAILAGREAIEKGIETEKAELEKLEEQFRPLKEGNGIKAYNEFIKKKREEKRALESRLMEVKKKILSPSLKVQKIEEYLERKENELVLPPEIAEIEIVWSRHPIRTKTIGDLNDSLVDLQRELKLLLQKYDNEDRRVLEKKNMIEQADAALQVGLEKAYWKEKAYLDGQEAQRDNLQEIIAEIDNGISHNPDEDSYYNILEQKIKEKEDRIADFSKMYQESLTVDDWPKPLFKVGGVVKVSGIIKIYPGYRFNYLEVREVLVDPPHALAEVVLHNVYKSLRLKVKLEGENGRWRVAELW